MSKNINGMIIVIEEEPKDTCTMCGKMDELRPYGPNFSRVCYDCAMKDEVGTEIRMGQMLFGDKKPMSEDEAKRLILAGKAMDN
jgi:hypothetical protein